MQFSISASGKLALLAILTSATVNSSPILEDRSSLEDRNLFKRAPLVMGSAKAFAAIASTTLTSTGATSLIGSGGTFPGTAITGWPPATVAGGSLYAGGSIAQTAKGDCQKAYTAAWALLGSATTISSSLGPSQTLTPGVYKLVPSAASLTGTLTLNGLGNPNSQFIFLITTTFTSAASSQILTINGAKPCNIYIANGSSSSIGSASKMLGNLISYTSISATNGASNKGTWCALNGAITLINNALTALPATC